MGQELNVCPICGSNLSFDAQTHRYECRFCGYTKGEEASSEETTLLYGAAQKLRLADFDEAAELYEDIVRKFPDCAEAYWGLALCEYGIKYEDDDDGKKVPTCYSARYECLYDNPNYKKAVDLAELSLRTYYVSQADRIEAIRKEWVSKAEKEPPYDIFLSFKDVDQGQRTQDSYDAHELYNVLTGLGYRVFFSRVTLQGKTGENFEPYIFSALNSASVMLVFASKAEYVNSTWVRNEWTRYLARIKAKKKQEGSLCVIFKDLSPSSLPVALKKKQNLKYGEITFLDTLRAYCEKMVTQAKSYAPKIERVEIALAKKKGQKTIEAVKTEKVTSIVKKQSNVAAKEVEKRQVGQTDIPVLTQDEEGMLAEASVYLEREDYGRANEIYAKVLTGNPHNADALLGQLLCADKSPSLERWVADQKCDSNSLPLALKVVDHAKPDVAFPVMGGCAKLVSRLLEAKDFKKALSSYQSIANYDVPCVSELHKEVFRVGTQSLDQPEAMEMIRLSIPYLSVDSEVFSRSLKEMMKECAGRGFFDAGREFARQFAEYFSYDLDSYLWTLCLQNETKDFLSLVRALGEKGDFSSVSGQLPLTQKDIHGLFDLLSAKTLELIQSDPLAANACVRFLLPYEFPARKEFIEKGIEACCDHPNPDVGKVLDGFLHAFDNDSFSAYLAAQVRFVDACLASEEYALAILYLDRLIEHDPDEPSYHFTRVCALCKCKTENLNEGIHLLGDFVDIERIIALRGNRLVIPTLKLFFEACIDSSSRNTAARVFDVLCSYVPQEENEALAYYLKCYASRCQSDGLFDLAEKYYSILVSFNARDHESYWSILQCRVGAKNDKELIEQPKALEDFVEFSNAKTAAAKDMEALKKYIDIGDKQKAWVKAEQAEAEQRRSIEAYSREVERKRKARKRTLIIVGSLALSVGAAFAVITPTLIVPANAFNGARTSILAGDYDAAIAALENNHYGDSPNLLCMAKAGKSFSGGDYETGIDYVLSAGGKVEVLYDDGAGTSTKSSETIQPKGKHIDNDWKRDGYTFNGWRQASFDLTITDGYSAKLRLDPLCELTAYSITYDLGGGKNSANNPATFTIEDEFDFEDPKRDGYTFLGWFDAEGKQYVSLPKGTMGDLLLFAHWNDGNHYVVTLDPTGGDLDQTSVEVQFDHAYALPVPVRTGYDFLGWFYGSTEPIPTTGTWRYGTSVSLKASWNPIEYTIVYELGGGVNSPSNPAKYTIETDDIILADPTRVGYVFRGWTLNGQPCASIPKGSLGDITLVATWSEIFQVTYVLNGGTNDPSNPTMFTAEDSIPVKQPTREGYTFVGWSDGVTTAKNYTIEQRDSDLTLTAIWKANVYSVTLDANGGTFEGDSVRQIPYDSTVSLPTPTREYYQFEGWYYGDVKIGSTWTITEDCTIVAKWKNPSIDHLTYEVFGKNAIRITGVNQSVKDLVIPEYIDDKPVTEIDEYAFQNNTSIETVVLPSTIETIGKYAFYQCTSLETLVLPKKIPNPKDHLFIGCSSLKTIKVEVDSSTDYYLAYLFTTIQEYVGDAQMLKWPASLTDIVVTKGKVVPKGFFYNLPKGVNVQYAESITEVMEKGFYWAGTYVFPSTITKVGDYAYFGMGNIGTEFTVHEGVTEIGTRAFSDTFFKTLNLPSTLTRLGSGSFGGYSNQNTVLKTVNYNGTKEKWLALTQVSSSYDSWAYQSSTSSTFRVNCTDAYYVGNVYGGGTWYDL